MLTVSDVSLRFSDRKLFDEVNIKFTEGNTYGLIGANGAGKSTFLKILAGDIEPTTGHISLGPNERLSVLRQNHFDYEEERAIDVVIMGNEHLYNILSPRPMCSLLSLHLLQSSFPIIIYSAWFSKLNM